jgi:hypothetical protein
VGLCIRGKNKKASGFYLRAGYRMLEEQPADAEIRTQRAWQTWCKQNEGHLRTIHTALLAETGKAGPRGA